MWVRTIYVDDTYSKALVRFLWMMRALAKLSNRSAVSSSLGAGSIATHGRGVTTHDLALTTLDGGARPSIEAIEVVNVGASSATTPNGARSVARNVMSFILDVFGG